MRRARNGGFAARRAVIRWAWRLFRREWRQQLLVLLLLAVAVTAAAAGISGGHHLPQPPQARFGDARQLLVFERSGPVTPEDGVAAAREWFGTIEVIGHREVAGLEIRAQDPAGVYSAPMLRTLAAGGPPESVTVLTAADQGRFDSFPHKPQAYAVRDNGERLAATAGVFGLLVVSMLLICLIAAGGFAVVAHRRQRQLGLLAAIGATQRHLRLVLLADGAVIGAVAATLGTAGGLALWSAALAPWLETAAAHRIERFDLPWWQFVAAFLLAVGTATAAAWRPARAAARIPVTRALSQRPPRPRPAHRSVLVAVVFLAAGIGCLALLGRKNPLLVKALEIPELLLLVAGIVAIGGGLLFAGPPAIRLLAAAASRLPVAVRLALRDLARHQARAGSTLAAVRLALAIPTAVVILTAVESHDPEGELAALRNTMTAAGGALALAILAMTIGLIRAETAGDLRTLAATGATARIRRTLTATTAGGLALLGGVLGIAVAYAGLIAAAGDQIGALARVPVTQLIVIAVGVPLAAAAAGWLLAGREPRGPARVRLE